ncbi:RHS repeat-associated core domain-containing protein [[Actinomadura] parvosata]
MRTAQGVTFLVNDHHGTAELAIDAADGSVSRRRYTPFGQVRAAKGEWPAGNEKGFVGGVVDATTDLTTLGARGYDPNTGRFISVDPEIEMGRSQQMNGYNYADNNPTTLSDPDGRFPYVNYYLLGYRQFWVRYGNYNYLMRQNLYLVHVYLNIFTHRFYLAVSNWFVAARQWAYLQGPVAPGKKPLLRQPGIPDLTPRPPAEPPKPAAPPKPKKGTVGLCGGLGIKLGGSFSVEACLVFDRKGVGLAGTYKNGLSTSIGAGATGGVFYSHSTIEGLNTTPGTWDAYHGIAYEKKGWGGGGYVMTNSSGKVTGGGAEVSYGLSKDLDKATDGALPVSVTTERGKTVAKRFGNPVTWFRERLRGFVWETYHPGG